MRVIAYLMAIFFLAQCTQSSKPLGSLANPIKIYFTPSVDAKVLEDNAQTLVKFLKDKTGWEFKVGIPQSYIAVVEAFGTKKADVAALTTYGYLLAKKKYGVEAVFTVLRHGKSEYKSQIIVRADGPINDLEQLNGKKIAFVDPASASGYLLPLKFLKDHHVNPKEIVFAGKHDNVVTMVYNKQVDAGATFWSEPDPQEGIQDARRLVKTQFPDVEKTIKILALTDPIPNDPIVWRKDLPEEVKSSLKKAFLEFVQSPEGQQTFKKIYGVDGLKPASDSDYEKVAAMLLDLGQNLDQLVQ